MTAPEKGRKERWIAIDDIPGIAAKDEIIIVNSARGIIVCRWLPLSKYSELRKYPLRRTPLEDEKDKPYPYPPTVVSPSGDPVSKPIQAGSDDAAIFELIYSTGGRMPED